MDITLMHPRDQIVMIMERIYHYGMTTTSGGNLSVRDENGDLWITPAGIDKGSLRAEDIVCVRADGSVQGIHRPSSEAPFHQAIYRRRPDIGAVLHGHPAALVAFSITHRLPETRLMPQVPYICGPLGYAPYALPGSDELGEKIADVFAEGYETVLLENHGVVTSGADLFQAFQRFETLDFSARIEVKARQLGDARPLSEAQLNLLRKARNHLPEFTPDSHTSREREVRKRLCAMIRRAYEQRLITSMGGTFSARLGPDSFLITPNGMDRKYLDEADLILVEEGRREAGKLPSRSVWMHRRVYQQHEELQAMIIAHPPNVMAFAVSGATFDSRTIPESFYVLREIQRMDYGEPFLDTEAVARVLTPRQPALLVRNDCIMVAGGDILEAFDRLEVAEFSAHALVLSGTVGAVQQITDEQVTEFRQAFRF